MTRVLRAGLMVSVLSFTTTSLAQDCCFDCTCAYCADIVSCQNSPLLTPGDCDPAGTSVCGVGTGTFCSTYYQNNTQGVQSDTPQPTDPNGCIPIDGGFGFLIAGGLGIGVIGIRRRKEELELERG